MWKQVLLFSNYVQIARSPSILSKRSRNGAIVLATQATLPGKLLRYFFPYVRIIPLASTAFTSHLVLEAKTAWGQGKEIYFFQGWMVGWRVRGKRNPYVRTHACTNTHTSLVCGLGRRRGLKTMSKTKFVSMASKAQESIRQESENWSRSQEIGCLVPAAIRLQASWSLPTRLLFS